MITLSELKEKCQELIDKGYGDLTIIKSSDDEGNEFDYVDSLNWSYAFTDGELSLLSHDYVEEMRDEAEEDGYEYEPDEVICIW